MSFGTRELRRGMDVFSADGELLGTVVQIRRRLRLGPSDGASVHDPRPASTAFTGEALGPMPTAPVGNPGPASQNPTTRYASQRPDGTLPDEEPADLLVFRAPVHLERRTLWPRLRRYPVSSIQNVSHERIVLAKPASELP
jgi:hypothetical protein